MHKTMLNLYVRELYHNGRNSFFLKSLPWKLNKKNNSTKKVMVNGEILKIRGTNNHSLVN